VGTEFAPKTIYQATRSNLFEIKITYLAMREIGCPKKFLPTEKSSTLRHDFTWLENDGFGSFHAVIALDTLTQPDFAKHVGEAFSLPEAGNGFTLFLESARTLGHHHPTAKREAFSLLFRGPANVRFPQRIYRLEHPAFGHLEIFLTQVSANAQGTEFEAIFT